MNEHDRNTFDALVEQAIEQLPPPLAAWLEEMPLIVLDHPTPDLLRWIDPPLQPEEAPYICGLHTGVANTDRSYERPTELPSQIHLFRQGILNAAGLTRPKPDSDPLFDEILVTLLHEIGHQMGLDEDDLEQLGYA